MLNVGIAIRVKFRAFGITFGTVEKAWTVGVSASAPLTVLEIPYSQAPDAAKKVYDQRGLFVRVW